MVINRRLTTQDISWFIDLEAVGQLNIDPPYQRRSVWSAADRRFFLDTIFRGYPSPPIFLHKQIEDGKTVYSVVDGKQRLETIFQFTANKLAIDNDFGDSRLAGQKWRSIVDDDELARAFWDYMIPVEMTNIIDTRTVNEIFDRLNRNQRNLKDQELRHARYRGWFIQLVETESESVDWEKLCVVTRARRKRMRDVQFLSELLIVLFRGDVGGFDQADINSYYAKYDDLDDVDDVDDVDDLADSSLDGPSVRQQFDSAKGYLLEVERDSSAISEYARDMTNFYSLWAVVALNLPRLPSPADLGKQYEEFMNSVGRFKQEKALELADGEAVPRLDRLAFAYYQSSMGARTEPPQRKERHRALGEAMLGVAS